VALAPASEQEWQFSCDAPIDIKTQQTIICGNLYPESCEPRRGNSRQPSLLSGAAAVAKYADAFMSCEEQVNHTSYRRRVRNGPAWHRFASRTAP